MYHMRNKTVTKIVTINIFYILGFWKLKKNVEVALLFHSFIYQSSIWHSHQQNTKSSWPARLRVCKLTKKSQSALLSESVGTNKAKSWISHSPWHTTSIPSVRVKPTSRLTWRSHAAEPVHPSLTVNAKSICPSSSATLLNGGIKKYCREIKTKGQHSIKLQFETREGWYHWW